MGAALSPGTTLGGPGMRMLCEAVGDGLGEGGQQRAGRPPGSAQRMGQIACLLTPLLWAWVPAKLDSRSSPGMLQPWNVGAVISSVTDEETRAWRGEGLAQGHPAGQGAIPGHAVGVSIALLGAFLPSLLMVMTTGVDGGYCSELVLHWGVQVPPAELARGSCP